MTRTNNPLTESKSPQGKPILDLSIVIPAYREEKRIGKTLDELSLYVKSEKYLRGKKVEVIVVAATAGDKTDEVVLSKASKFKTLRLLKPGPRGGKGRDVMYGMVRAKGKAVVFMDADLSTPHEHLEEFYKALNNGADVIIATRDLHKHHPNYLRRALSNGGNLLFRIASGMWVEDSQCGFKLFSWEAAQICFNRLNILGWGFDMEVLAIAKANKMKIKFIRVDDWHHVPNGTFELNMISNFALSLVDLSRIVYRRATRAYLVS